MLERGHARGVFAQQADDLEQLRWLEFIQGRQRLLAQRLAGHAPHVIFLQIVLSTSNR